MTIQSRVALLVDAENTAPKSVLQMMTRGQSFGKLSILRCYGDANSLKNWQDPIAKFHFVPVLTPPSAFKNNASDFALTIDAVSLLHRNLFDHLLVASSDADFTQLAIHVREYGKGVHGLGDSKAIQCFRSAFDSFTVFSAIPKPKLIPTLKPGVIKPSPKVVPIPVLFKNQPLVSAFEKNAVDGKLSLSDLGKILRADYPAIEVKKGKLKKMIIDTGLGVVDGLILQRIG